MMPMNGAYHGHTGEMAITTVFPTPGFYTIRMEVNSLPVSDVQFSHVKASFNILVVEGTNNSPVGTSTVANQISILGQAAPYYGPKNMIVRVGQTVTFKNGDFVMHTATGTDATAGDSPSAPNGVFDTGILGHGQEKQVTFDKAGTFNYFCQIHPQMRGTVTVTG
jgi:plastocyanin